MPSVATPMAPPTPAQPFTPQSLHGMAATNCSTPGRCWIVGPVRSSRPIGGPATLSPTVSFYDPISYHQSTVWPLFTGWVSVF